jgi:hypothetical protein
MQVSRTTDNVIIWVGGFRQTEDVCAALEELEKLGIVTVTETDLPEGFQDSSTSGAVELEKQYIRGCDAAIINLEGGLIEQSMQVIYAYLNGRAVVAVCDLEGKNIPWIDLHTMAVCETLEGAVQYVTAMVEANRRMEDVDRDSNTSTE